MHFSSSKRGASGRLSAVPGAIRGCQFADGLASATMRHAQPQSSRAHRRRQAADCACATCAIWAQDPSRCWRRSACTRAEELRRRGRGARFYRTQARRDQLLTQYAVGAGRCAGAMAGGPALARGGAWRCAPVAAAGAGGLRAALDAERRLQRDSASQRRRS